MIRAATVNDSFTGPNKLTSPLDSRAGRAPCGFAARRCRVYRTISGLAACLLAIAFALPARAQQEKRKVPIIGKLSSNPSHQAYSGKIQSVDMKAKILNVNALKGQDTEIFPIRKDIRVEGINGEKLKLKQLTPGTSVLIYYEQKRGEREIKNIIVLEGAKDQGKGAAAPPS